MAILTVYFSRAGENYFGGSYRRIQKGNTQITVEQIAELISTKCFPIEMAQPYSDDYKQCVAQAVVDFRANARPALKNTINSIDEFDTVIVAYPCYCGTAPMAVFTFLEQFSWEGKTILPLCTNEGSGMGKSEQDLQKICVGANLKKGIPIRGSAVSEAKPAIEAWLRDCGVL